MSFTLFKPFRIFEPFYGPGRTPETTPEIEFITSEGQAFHTSDNEQVVVQET